MAVYTYKKYKVSLSGDSNKTQGLRAGDIVRRQYVDGKASVYSLMCVLGSGTDTLADKKEQPYFIGALLEGDAPKNGELLDFARITNLFDTSRSGALYLTGSDKNAPYMDIVDGIGRNASLCWPESIAGRESVDSQKQYVIEGQEDVSAVYDSCQDGNNRVCRIVRNEFTPNRFVGLKQDFDLYVANPDRVLISYKVKATSEMTARASIEYSSGSRVDGVQDVSVTTEWKYQFHAVTVEWSGRHLRSFKLDLSALHVGEEVWVADLNVILLSSISNFSDSSQARVGKLEGVTDSIFGRLAGYGAYLKKLFASGSTHVSGTLTAGDEHGFSSTFYAGKIHRNTFVNSLEVNFTSGTMPAPWMTNPTGVGNVYLIEKPANIAVQSREWLGKHAGERYCFSFWMYAKQAGRVVVKQNGQTVGTLSVIPGHTHAWHRHQVTFRLSPPQKKDTGMSLTIDPTFNVGSESPDDAPLLYFAAPQLESGDTATQYQPTDGVLNYTEDYGAWMSRGGIGGTIQNPLLQLNYDGEGAIGTRTKSFLVKPDGSGYLANKNIRWDKRGKVTFGEGVTLNWGNLDEDVKEELVSKSIKIEGGDTFVQKATLSGEPEVYEPPSILLSIAAENITALPGQCQWCYLRGTEYVPIQNATEISFEVLPNADYWRNTDTLILKCVANANGNIYSDTITVKKIKEGKDTISVFIYSSNGSVFRNGNVSTVLTARVLKGNEDITDKIPPSRFSWEKKSANAEPEEAFNASHAEYGPVLSLSSQDVLKRATFDCIVLI
jgi:hypothetical protein